MNYAPPLRLASSLGLRIGELLGLRWEDFDRDKGYLHVKTMAADGRVRPASRIASTITGCECP